VREPLSEAFLLRLSAADKEWWVGRAEREGLPLAAWMRLACRARAGERPREAPAAVERPAGVAVDVRRLEGVRCTAHAGHGVRCRMCGRVHDWE
jgi:hypothetical protein